ncbi:MULTISPECIES: hypothetical protein [unclassified Streptomyces]|uniref:hypothetical protein n=1 Tax=unclassified Streptomyces TaxID=2593676 RepID=UPI00168B6552|nr:MULTISPECIES: hypothetical protein [unclassified Streptomyces]MBD3006396.1 hypothetical protein [Streptomyces sp. 5-10]
MTDVLVDGREVVIRLRVRRLVCPQTLRIAPAYRPTLVDPYRGHFRERRQADPAAPVLHLFREIKEHGYTGGLNLLHRYHNQGRMKATAPSPLRATPAASCSPTRNLRLEETACWRGLPRPARR